MSDKQKILIVDDDENIAELISLYLTKECFETLIVHDGESALREFSLFKPHLIILDLMLPGIDGNSVSPPPDPQRGHRCPSLWGGWQASARRQLLPP